MNIKIDPKDMQEVRDVLSKLSGDEVKKATVRSVNKTMTGVRTDGVKILTDHYALTASAIRESWSIKKAYFDNPLGVVSSTGMFIRLINYGARQVNSGVSVKVLKSGGRKIVQHAFIGKIRVDRRAHKPSLEGKMITGQSNEQVYRRVYHDEKHGGKSSKIRMMAGKVGFIWSAKQNRYIPAKWLPEEYRLPVRALYGPRIQDYLADPVQIKLLTDLAGKRLIQYVAHEVDYLLSKAKLLPGGEE